MPTKPNIRELNANTPDIMNAIRNSASANYREMVPTATDANVREIGTIIMGNPTFQNEFLSGLVNRIGQVLVTSKMYKNPWAMFKKGKLEFGETIEEIFVALAKAHTYDVDVAENEVFRREIPDVQNAFHVLNYQKFYKVTIQEEQLRQAFLSMDGVTSLISKIVESMYTSAEYDEFNVMKYMIAKHLLTGTFYPVQVTDAETDPKNVVKAMKKISNQFTFMQDKYNYAGVPTLTLKENQYLIVNADFDATMDVDVMASAFNMDKVEFLGHRVLIDGFDKIDTKRMNYLFKDDPNYTEIDQSDLTKLAEIPAVIVDLDWFMIFDNMEKFTEIYNAQGLYWNYFYHVWKIVSVSPFQNAVALVNTESTVENVTVTPSTATVPAGGQVALSAKVETTGFAPQAVEWSMDEEKGTVDYKGNVRIKKSVTGTVTVTATSVFNKTKSGSCTITVN